MVVVAVLEELATPEVSPGVPLAVAPEDDVEPVVEPGAPIELVLPGVVEPLPVVDDVPTLAEVSVLDVPAVLPGVDVLPDGAVVVDELDDDVVGVAVSSRLVQAPRETAATSASAAHEVRDAFIGTLLEGLLNSQGQPGLP